MTNERGWPWDDRRENEPTTTEPGGGEQGMDFPSPDPWRSQGDTATGMPASESGPMAEPAIMERQEEARERVASAKKATTTRRRATARKAKAPARKRTTA